MTVSAAVLPCACGALRGCHIHGPQPREHEVPCRSCTAGTWNAIPVCDRCHAICGGVHDWEPAAFSGLPAGMDVCMWCGTFRCEDPR